MFNRLKDGISKSMTTMNVNSNFNLETNKLKLMIENTRRAIEELVKEMGWAAYRAMKEPDTDLSLLNNYVKNIDEKKQEITRLTERIQELEAERQLVLGNLGNEPGKCSQCGEVNPENAVFCRKCGNKLAET